MEIVSTNIEIGAKLSVELQIESEEVKYIKLFLNARHRDILSTFTPLKH
jgi:hypothetical protein